jgi:hypothetical protein
MKQKKGNITKHIYTIMKKKPKEECGLSYFFKF